MTAANVLGVLNFSWAPEPLVGFQSPANEAGAALSPNGKWQVSNGGGGFPPWSGDGKQLYRTVGDKLMLVAIENAETFEFGAPDALSMHVNEFAALGPAAPGERFPALKALSAGQSHPQEVILNWTGTLKQ
jgi:hypothetical protein